jgi:uridine phosphorylase
MIGINIQFSTYNAQCSMIVSLRELKREGDKEICAAGTIGG